MGDKYYMQIAIDLALKGQGRTSPNPVVGAVVVKNKRIVATGYHSRCGADHAEIVALKKAGKRAKGATLYITLEPCSHFGRTPPCVDAVIKSGIKKVVVATKDPNPANNGKSIRELKNADIKTKVGVLKDKALNINEPFIKFMTKRLPFVVVKSAQTLDGKIATFSGQSKWVTSRVSRRYARRLRNNFDAIVVGINTVIRDNPSLDAAEKSKRLKKVIIDSNLRISPRANVFKNTAAGDVIIATTQKAAKAKINTFIKRGTNVVVCPKRDNRVNLRYLFRELAKRDISNILIEGGSEVIGGALKEKLVDKMIIFVAPKIIGDQSAIGSIRGLRINNVNKAITLKNMTVKSIANDILIEGYVCYNK